MLAISRNIAHFTAIYLIHSIAQKLNTPIAAHALPVDFAARYAAGLAGSMQEKISLLDAFQQALFGTPLESLEHGLLESQAQIWQEIVRRVKVI